MRVAAIHTSSIRVPLLDMGDGAQDKHIQQVFLLILAEDMLGVAAAMVEELAETGKGTTDILAVVVPADILAVAEMVAAFLT